MPGIVATLIACTAVAWAGPEPLPSGKEMKQVAPAPVPECDWRGFYLGADLGGEFGHSEEHEVGSTGFGYHESGFTGSGVLGYNWQWGCVVLGPEIDLGYTNIDGHGSPAPFIAGTSNSDFFATFRGRLGIGLNKWLIYGTGGAMVLNYNAHVFDPQDRTIFDYSSHDLDAGYTVGGGIERRIGCHWGIKVEYLYFNLNGERLGGPVFFNGQNIGPDHFDPDTTGHLVRAGINFHF